MCTHLVPLAQPFRLRLHDQIPSPGSRSAGLLLFSQLTLYNPHHWNTSRRLAWIRSILICGDAAMQKEPRLLQRSRPGIAERLHQLR